MMERLSSGKVDGFRRIQGVRGVFRVIAPAARSTLLVLAGVALVTAVGGASQSKTIDRITTTSLVLVDEDGNEKAILSTRSGRPYLELRDGLARAQLHINADGSSHLVLHGNDESVHGATISSGVGYPMIALRAKEKKGGVFLWASDPPSLTVDSPLNNTVWKAKLKPQRDATGQ